MKIYSFQISIYASFLITETFGKLLIIEKLAKIFIYVLKEFVAGKFGLSRR